MCPKAFPSSIMNTKKRKRHIHTPFTHAFYTYTHIHSPPTLSTNANAASHVFLLLVTYVHPPWMQGGYTALINAANGGHLEIVQQLLKSGANTDLQDYVRRGDGVGPRVRGRGCGVMG